MSVNATSQASNIWARATTALTNSPSAQGLGQLKPNEAGGAKAKTGPIQAGVASANPFQSLSNDLQSTIIQLQAQVSGKG